MTTFLDFLLSPFKAFFWLLSIPVRIFTFVVTKIKTKNYDPERAVCPGCGFRGDSGTNKKTCRINHVAVEGAERAMNEHICFRCSAKYYTKLFKPAVQWIGLELRK